MPPTQLDAVVRHIHQMADRDGAAPTDAHLLRRFLERRDEAAFGALVRRHGRMVFRVCRGVLRGREDAEDAFQATFLVLARCAAKIRSGAALSGWLYGVAYRVAQKARQAASRRQAHEREARQVARTRPAPEPALFELQQILAEEVSRLPEKHRAPFVLCCLEGKSKAEAAAQLGWKEGTVAGRLARARERIRQRLTRRGVTLAAVLCAGALSAGEGLALPPPLVKTTIKVALAAAAGCAAAGAVRAPVAALAEGVTRAMLTNKVKIATLLALAAALLAAGAGALAGRPGGAALAREAPPPPAAPPRAEPPADAAEVSGRVLDPDGKPLAGAKLYLLEPFRAAKAPTAVRATTDGEGRFRLALGDGGGKVLFAAADGYGPAWTSDFGKSGELTLRLAKDDVPVGGRILDLEGRPLAGVTVRVREIKAPARGKLDDWLGALKVRRDGIPLETEYLSVLRAPELHELYPAATTGKDGRFRLAGVGRDRVVTLRVEEPTIETREVNVVTRAGVKTVTVPYFDDYPESGELTYHAATFDHPAAPCRVVSGVVRDKATGKPIAGADVRAETPIGYLRTTADKEGRYRLTGLPRGQKGKAQAVVAMHPAGAPYLAVRKVVEGSDDSPRGPITVDFDVKKGVWLEGRVTDKEGRGVEANLGYYVLIEALDKDDAPELYLPVPSSEDTQTDEQGRYRIVAYPGRGLVGARAIGAREDHFCVGAGAEDIKGGGPSEFKGFIDFPTYPARAVSANFNGMKEVKPAAGDKAVTCDLVLDPGRALAVRPRGPDGKPLQGAWVMGQLSHDQWSREEGKGGEYPIYGLKPGESRTLLLRHEGKGLAGVLKIGGDDRGAVTAKLVPAAAVTGRLLDRDGRPLPHAAITARFYLEDRPGWIFDHHPLKIHTDADGKFRIDGLTPGLKYHAMTLLTSLSRRPYPGEVFALTLKEGETKDLGDVKVKRADDD
jgi:RNA polymerase sigma factor (sigma-70 family)